MSLLSNIGAGARRMVGFIFQRSSYRIFSQPNSNIDYATKVGDGTGSSLVVAAVGWLAKAFPEAPPSLWRKTADQVEEPVLDHPMLRLLDRPNHFYSGPNLWMATVTDWKVDGNAYWYKLRNKAGAVAEIWWIPHWLIEPVGDQGTFIDHYAYRPGSETLRIDKEDIIHFRNGIDPDDSRLGQSPLKSVLREIFTDNEAAAYTAALLGNMAVPGLLIAPEKGVTLNEGDAAEVKRYVNEKFAGDRRGEAMVMTGATTVEQFGFSPDQLNLRDIRRIPEERVTAVLGVPAIVAGLGAGLDRSTFTNMGEARAAAYEEGLIPMQKIMGEDIRFQLLNEFEEDPYMWRFGWDLSKVRVLQDDQLKLARKWDVLMRAGLAMRSEGRRAQGLPVDDDRDNVFILPLNTVTVPGTDTADVPELPEQRRLSAVAGGLLQLEQRTAAGLADVKALVTEHAQRPEPLPALPPVINFFEGAFQQPPAPNVSVTLPAQAEKVVMRRENGTETTYELAPVVEEQEPVGVDQ
jgi:HK97 family phage portal protein